MNIWNGETIIVLYWFDILYQHEQKEKSLTWERSWTLGKS